MILIIKTFEFVHTGSRYIGISPAYEEWLISADMPYRLVIK